MNVAIDLLEDIVRELQATWTDMPRQRSLWRGIEAAPWTGRRWDGSSISTSGG